MAFFYIYKCSLGAGEGGIANIRFVTPCQAFRALIGLYSASIISYKRSADNFLTLMVIVHFQKTSIALLLNSIKSCAKVLKTTMGGRHLLPPFLPPTPLGVRKRVQIAHIIWTHSSTAKPTKVLHTRPRQFL